MSMFVSGGAGCEMELRRFDIQVLLLLLLLLLLPFLPFFSGQWSNSVPEGSKINGLGFAV